DAKMACCRHATSKLREIDDLDSINTLGFRGEALASISAVSQMDIVTYDPSGETGVHVYVESGEVRKLRPAGREPGTTIEVRNLFYNVPARRKFLKKGSTELAEIVNVVGRFIVAHPDIEFKLVHGNRCLMHAARSMSMLERIRLALGGDAADHMVKISFSDGGYGLDGYVSRPSSTRKDKTAQMFFVNGRFIKSGLVSAAVQDAYRSLLERGRYPSVVLFLKVPPPEVDVNVHPTKLQIKFSDDPGIKRMIRDAISRKFEEMKQGRFTDMTGTLPAGPAGIEPGETPVFSGVLEVQTEFKYSPVMSEGKGAGAPLSGGTAGEKPSDSRAFAEPGKQEEEIFQTGGCYLVRVKSGGITVIDQHAAHERVLYEFFGGVDEGKTVESQNLLFPVRLDLSASESVIMEKVMKDMCVLGFDIELFGENSFIIRAVPAVIKDRDIRTVVYDILTDLSSYDPVRINRLDELIKLTSCRAAIKAGDVLSGKEMFSLLEQLNKCKLPFTCPHGRPTMLEITVDELEKRFRRK
ncbi:MAG: DNA mismatch repair endonuclease MutL, partial [Candidatus Omnitrophota bacterium]